MRLLRRCVARRVMGCCVLGLWALGASGCLRAAEEVQEAPALAEGEADWNDGAIAWTTHEAGLARAAAERRPIVLVFYTDWCPHCHNFSRVFHAPDVVDLAREFVMIRVERDSNRDVSEMYDLDGEYIPRTFFLTSAGEVRSELHGNNPSYRYFVDEHDSRELVALMRRALVP